MTDLRVFFEAQVEKKKNSLQIDWVKRKEKWLFELDGLFRSITLALLDAGWTNDQIILEQHLLKEELLGDYKAPGLIVVLPAGGQIKFQPIGSVIIGGFGRVDAIGPTRKRVRLIAEDAAKDRSRTEKVPSYEREWQWIVYPGVGGMSGSFPLDVNRLGNIFSVLAGSD